MTTYYANPDETSNTGATYTFNFGAYGDTTVVVFGRPDRVGDALETAAECLLEHEPGLFSEPHYAGAMAELNFDIPADDAEADEQVEAARELAEADHTHTESGWLPSWEWTVDESEGEPFDAPVFNRFDICQAHASYQAAWHQGQWSPGYADLCRAQALCTNAVRDFDDLTENGQAIYRQLVLRDGR